MLEIGQITSDPLVLLIFGAIFSGILIPYVTRIWQKEQKKIEIKTDLAKNITEVSTKFILSIQFAELRATSQSQEDYDLAYKEWSTSSSIIRTQIKSYYKDEKFVEEWNKYVKFVEEVYRLSGTQNDERVKTVERIKTYFINDEDLNNITNLFNRGVAWQEIPSFKWQTAYEIVKTKLFEELGYITTQVIEKKIKLEV